MVRVTVELVSAIDGHIENLGTMIIANDGTGTDDIGNYRIGLLRKNAKYGQPYFREAVARGYKRKTEIIWKLIYLALKSTYPEFK